MLTFYTEGQQERYLTHQHLLLPSSWLGIITLRLSCYVPNSVHSGEKGQPKISDLICEQKALSTKAALWTWHLISYPGMLLHVSLVQHPSPALLGSPLEQHNLLQEGICRHCGPGQKRAEETLK